MGLRKGIAMKSIKPGRGPSMMGGIGSVAVVICGIIWTLAAVSMDAPIFFPLFGLVFIGMGIAEAVYSFKNASGENRYSSFDIVDSSEEPDPLNERFGRQAEEPAPDVPPEGFAYCPYCGAKLGEGFTFCGKCGRELPKETKKS